MTRYCVSQEARSQSGARNWNLHISGCRWPICFIQSTSLSSTDPYRCLRRLSSHETPKCRRHIVISVKSRHQVLKSTPLQCIIVHSFLWDVLSLTDYARLRSPIGAISCKILSNFLFCISRPTSTKMHCQKSSSAINVVESLRQCSLWAVFGLGDWSSLR